MRCWRRRISAAWSGRRDHALMLLAVQTGLRLSELTGLRPEDVQLGAGAHVRVHRQGAQGALHAAEQDHARGADRMDARAAEVAGQPVFPNAHGGRLSAHGVHYLLAKHVATAAATCPSLKQQAREPARAAAHDGDGLAAGRRGASGDRAVARPRVDRDDADVPGRRPGNEAEAFSTRRRHRRQAGRYRPDDKLLAFLKGL